MHELEQRRRTPNTGSRRKEDAAKVTPRETFTHGPSSHCKAAGRTRVRVCAKHDRAIHGGNGLRCWKGEVSIVERRLAYLRAWLWRSQKLKKELRVLGQMVLRNQTQSQVSILRFKTYLINDILTMCTCVGSCVQPEYLSCFYPNTASRTKNDGQRIDGRVHTQGRDHLLANGRLLMISE